MKKIVFILTTILMMMITIPFQIEAAPPDKDINDGDIVYEYNLYLYSSTTSGCFQTIARSNGDLSLIEELWNITDPATNKVVTGWNVWFNADFSGMPEIITKENGSIEVTESDCYLVPYSWVYNLYLYSGITSECFQTIGRSNGDLSLIEELWNITDPAMNKVVTGWSVYYNADFSDTMPECITEETTTLGTIDSDCDCYLVPYSWEETQSNTILVYFYYSITDNQHFAFTDFTLEEVAHYSNIPSIWGYTDPNHQDKTITGWNVYDKNDFFANKQLTSVTYGVNSGETLDETITSYAFVASEWTCVHDYTEATTTNPQTCIKCGHTIGDIIIPEGTWVVDTYLNISGSLIENQIDLSEDGEIYLHTFVANTLPTSPLEGMITSSETSTSTIINFYYLLSQQKIYIYLDNTWQCYTDIGSISVGSITYNYGGFVTNKEEISTTTNPIFYFQKVQRKIIYHFSDGTTSREVSFENWSKFDDFTLSNQYLIIGTYTDSNYQYNILDNGLSSEFETYKTDITWTSDTKDLYVKVKRILGIKYYYQDTIVKEDNTFTFYTDLWNMETIDTTSFCPYEHLYMYCKDKNISTKEIQYFYQLEVVYMNYLSKLEDSFYVEIEIQKVHDRYYYGAELIYKNSVGFLNTKEIETILEENMLSCYHTLTHTFQDISYVGNGTKNGTYEYSIIFENGFVQKIKIIVTDKIASDYIYGNHFYFPINDKLSNEQIVKDLKTIGLLPNTNLSTQFVGRNEASSNYLSGKTSEVGTYSYTVDYDSASGESGTIQIYLDVLQAKSYTTEDEESTSNWKDFVIPIVVILLIIVVLCLIFGRRRHRRR